MLTVTAAGVGVLLVGGCAGDSPGASRAAVSPSAASESPAATVTPLPTPTGPPSLAFAVIGDFGSGTAMESAVAARMCRLRANRPFDLVITTGDNVYPDGSPTRFEDAFFEPFDCLLSNGASFHASLGNHDVKTRKGRPELREDAFGFRGRNYVVREMGVRFVIADSNELDRAWLRGALGAQAGDRWTVVVFHHPVYSPGTGHGSTPGFRPGLPRMFRRAGVDLVLNGHDHAYAVTHPLKGIRYVVTGGGGAHLYGCRDRWFSEVCVARHHFLYVVAGPEWIRVRAIPPEGPVFHRFSTLGRS